jgi:hypothetical protein
VGVNHTDVDTDILVLKSNGSEVWVKGDEEGVEREFIAKVQVSWLHHIRYMVLHRLQSELALVFSGGGRLSESQGHGDSASG